jgi:hypothetical protein
MTIPPTAAAPPITVRRDMSVTINLPRSLPAQPAHQSRDSRSLKTPMAGTSPAMTSIWCNYCENAAPHGCGIFARSTIGFHFS